MNILICPQDVFTEYQWQHVLTNKQLCWLEDLFEAICLENINKIDVMMEEVKV